MLGKNNSLMYFGGWYRVYNYTCRCCSFLGNVGGSTNPVVQQTPPSPILQDYGKSRETTASTRSGTVCQLKQCSTSKQPTWLSKLVVWNNCRSPSGCPLSRVLFCSVLFNTFFESIMQETLDLRLQDITIDAM